MHFNHLLMGFRLKALGVIALGGTIAVGLDHKDVLGTGTVAGILGGLAVIWALIGIVDFFYYYRLLAGAVDELLRLERKLPDVWLSNQIAWRVEGDPTATSPKETFTPPNSTRSPDFPSWPIWVFYVVPLLLLIFLSVGFVSSQWLLSSLLVVIPTVIFILLRVGFGFGRRSTASAVRPALLRVRGERNWPGADGRRA
jgi:hypothetical protein